MPNVPAPVTIVGDIHGQFYDLLEIFNICGKAPETNFLFLGDYVDRGNNSLECFCYVLILKVKYRNRITYFKVNSNQLQVKSAKLPNLYKMGCKIFQLKLLQNYFLERRILVAGFEPMTIGKALKEVRVER